MTFKKLYLVLVYGLAFAALAVVEMLSIGQNMADSSVKLSFQFATLLNNLPSLLTSYAAVACYTAVTLTNEVLKFLDTDKEALDLQQQIHNFASTRYRPTLFNKFCHIKNRQRKINAWKYVLSTQFQKLERKETNDDFNEWTRYLAHQEEMEKNKGLEPFKTTNKYCIKRIKLERMLSDKYIEENIDRISIEYDAINSSLILGGVREDSRFLFKDSYVTKGKGLKVFKDRAPTSILMFVLIAMVTSASVEMFNLDFHWTAWLLFVLKMITKVFTLSYVVYSMVHYAKEYNQQVTLADLRFRYGILCEHDAWIIKQGG